MPPPCRSPNFDEHSRGIARCAHDRRHHQRGCVVLCVRSIALVGVPAALGKSLDLIRSPAKHRHLQYTRRYVALAPARRISWHVSDPVFIICSDDSRSKRRWSNAMIGVDVESCDGPARAATCGPSSNRRPSTSRWSRSVARHRRRLTRRRALCDATPNISGNDLHRSVNHASNSRGLGFPGIRDKVTVVEFPLSATSGPGMLAWGALGASSVEGRATGGHGFLRSYG